MADEIKQPEVKETPVQRVVVPETKPQMPKPVPDKIKNMTFSVEDFDVAQLPTRTPTKEEQVKLDEQKPADKKEEKKVDDKVETPSGTPKEDKQEEKKEDKKEDKKEEPFLSKILKAPTKDKKEDAKGEDKKEVVKQIVPGARDYSGYTAQEASALKQMSNEAFELATRLIKDNKELKKLEGTTYLQHEHAYVLDPQYQSLRTDNTFALKEAAYWQEQLVNMDAGKDFVPITGWNNDGSPILGTPKKPTKADEEQVRVMMNNCYQASNQIQSRLQQYPGQYKQRLSQDLQELQTYRAQQFGWVTKPELMDYSVNIEGLGDRSLKQIREDVKSLIPVYLRNSPLTDLVGDLVISLRIQSAELSELRNGKAIDTIKQEEQKHIEPTSNNKPSSPRTAVHGITEFKVDPELASIGIH